MRLRLSRVHWLAVVLVLISTYDPQAFGEDDVFFESEVRPILTEKCGRCHGSEKQSGGLRVDSLERLLQGGESGAAIIAGDAERSLLIEAVKRGGSLKMPPDQPLNARQIDALAQWIGRGAAWPKSVAPAGGNGGKDHWAFQPVGAPEPPSVKSSPWVRNSIDAFVLGKLEQHGLEPSPPADAATLVRRAYYAITGVPPTIEDVERFVHSRGPDAYATLVDRLLASHAHGEHWARQWLDAARYADTKGYVYAREERFWPHAWTYRDWVVKSFNHDLPYDRFLKLQIAADKVADRDDGDLAAMGFLTLGRRFLGVKHDIIDDRIDVVTRGMMGLTVSCARCHDHKYDPIPSADYYSLYGVFDSSLERLIVLHPSEPPSEEFQRELRTRQEKLRSKMSECANETIRRARSRVGDYLKAQTELEKYPADGFDQVFSKDDVLPAFVRQWQDFLRGDSPLNHRIFFAWHAYAKFDKAQLHAEAEKLIEQWQSSKPHLNPLVKRAFAVAPQSFDDVIQRYAALFRDVDLRWQAALAAAAERKETPPTELPDWASEELRQVLYGEQGPCLLPDQSIVHCETYFDSQTVDELWKLQGEVDRWLIKSSEAVPCALALADRPYAIEPRIFRRGNPLQRGDVVPRRFPSILAGGHPAPFRDGSGRLELAQAIVDPGNPLTARVIVNRVWARIFGQGLVSTPSDFGVRAEAPSHPELLDWLAADFVAQGWSLKKLRRMILTSASFCQSSSGPTDAATAHRYSQIDPRNRLLWRMNRKRLSFEEFRDSMLVATRQIDWAAGGKPTELFAKPFTTRRTLYGLVDRQFFPSTLRTFDFANPDLHIPTRAETTVPQQSLYLLNHPIVLEQARRLARLSNGETRANARGSGDGLADSERARRLFELALHRAPSRDESRDAMAFVTSVDVGEPVRERTTAEQWKYGFGSVDEKTGKVTSFMELPYFSGSAWQGSAKWPDAKLGWAQLSAKGGHPGNDLQHAVIRRWVAPKNMLLSIQSKLIHDAAPGDGVRASIVSSASGRLRSETAHQQTLSIDIASAQVSAGETIDFVVDIGKVLSNDQYQWIATLSEFGGAGTPWNSFEDFTVTRVPALSPWEQLAQALLCTNEFSFVD